METQSSFPPVLHVELDVDFRHALSTMVKVRFPERLVAATVFQTDRTTADLGLMQSSQILQVLALETFLALSAATVQVVLGRMELEFRTDSGQLSRMAQAFITTGLIRQKKFADKGKLANIM